MSITRKPSTRILGWCQRITVLLLVSIATPLVLAQPEPAPGGRGAPQEDMVKTVIMVDMPLDAVLKYLEQLTGKAILRSQSLPAVKINFDSLGPMSRDEAIRAVESLLALNGILITPVGDEFLKAVAVSGPGGPTAQVPKFLTGSALVLPPSQAFYTKMFKLQYLDAMQEGQALIQGMATQGSPLIVFQKNNAILITDMLVNLQRIEQILKDADKPDLQAENVFFFQLSNIKALDLVQRLQKLTQGNTGLARFFANNTTFEADERTNQLIVITHPSNEPLLEDLIGKLDKDVEPVTSSEVFYIKHAQATEIDTLLEEVISGQQSARENSESANSRNTNSPESQTAASGGNTDALVADAAPLPSPTQGVTGGEVDTKNLQFSDFVTVVADERSNAIVAYGTKTDLRQIGILIEQIDVLLAQVFIEVLIAEVTLTDEAVSGISELGFSGNELEIAQTDTPFGVIPFPERYGFAANVQGQAGSRLVESPPFEFNFTLNPEEFNLVIRTAAENSNVRILSAPNIVTTHNQEANVNVSQSRPIITSTVQNLATGSTNGTTSNDVQFRDIGIQLKVKPLIGSNGIIQMEIEQIVENVIELTDINGIQQPIIGKREATSFVSVADGQVIVLAGLQETSFSTSQGEIWLLGDIPLLGDWLNPNAEVNERRELMIFINPTVYFGPQDASNHANDIIERLDNGGDVTTFMRSNDMSEITREQREESLRQSQEFIEQSRGDNPLEVNEIEEPETPESSDASLEESTEPAITAPTVSSNRNPDGSWRFQTDD
ncbi:MAG: secretin N-terminal domain-containing protein [Verrucomicrobiota bacterium]